ncbi:MAG: N-acetylmuramoyl-L-alanine amidase [Terracidiphilus sp.]
MASLEIPRIPAACNRASRLYPLLCILAVWTGAGSLAAQAPPASPPRFMVVLDAAHGGDDPGAKLSDGQPEKAFTLALSVRLRSLLGARGMQVITTRESDATIDLNRRAEIANHANAQACLSLHASETGTGIHLFVSSLSPAPPREGVRFLAWRTAQSAWVTRSVALAGVLNSVLLHAGLSVTLGRTALPAVDSMACPAVAIEVAPESAAAGAPGEPPAAPLNDPAYQARVAEALAAAMLEWRADAGRMEATQP